MTLAAGTRLGVYEIVCSLGAGGMGEVYRARDARLGRGVARLDPVRDGGADAETAAATAPGMMIGTPRYMSPEQAAGDAAGSAADIFAFGLLLYELATGRHPFARETNASVLRGILAEAAVPPSQFNPDLPDLVDALVARMLEKDPERRPPAGDVERALQALGHLVAPAAI